MSPTNVTGTRSEANRDGDRRITIAVSLLITLVGTIALLALPQVWAESNGADNGRHGQGSETFDTGPPGFPRLRSRVSDEFNRRARAQPSNAKWGRKSYCNYGPGAPAWPPFNSQACDRPDPDHVFEDGNGYLHLQAIRGWQEPGGGVWSGWTVAHLASKATLPPPYVMIVRAKTAHGFGMWSAPAWITNEGFCGEVDFEQLGRQPRGINQSVHGSTCGTTFTRYTDAGARLARRFHTYAAYVYADHARFYVDGTRTATIRAAHVAGSLNLIHPSTFHISLNVGTCGSWADCPPPGARSPAEMVVDWFRVYTRS
jgi:beta-glucanase (GH16 family)